MKKTTNYISGLDIQREYISIAQYSPDEKAVFNVAIQPISSGDTLELWECAGKGLKELNVKFKFSSRDIVCSLPTEYAIVKWIDVENEEPDLKGFLEWELSQQIIGSIDEYSFDFQECSSKPGNNAKEYLVVAYRNEHVQKIASFIKELKLIPQIVDLDVFAIVNTFEANYPERISEPTILIHGEGEKTKIIFTRNGIFIDLECLDYTYGTITPEIYAQKLNQEIGRILSKNQVAVTQENLNVFFTGALFSQAEYTESVSAEIGRGNLLNPFRKIGCRVGVENEQLMAYASQLAVAVGLAIRGVQ
jgi:Tfp pilus assembly PilM family ATPase